MFALTLLLGAVIRRVGWLLRRPFSCSSSRHFPCIAGALASGHADGQVERTIRGDNGDFTGSAAPYPYNAWLLVQGVVPRSITVFRRTAKYLRRIQSRFVHREIADEDRERIREGELECYKKFHVENVAVYIADDQFWTLQFREGLLCLAAGVIMAVARC